MTCNCVHDVTPLSKDLGSLQVGSKKCESGDAGDRSSIDNEDEDDHKVVGCCFENQ